MLITGGTGFLGRHLMMACEHASWETLAPSSTSMDIRSAPRVLDEITTWKPQVVVHLAYRRDDHQVIVDGSLHIARAAAAAGARLIHLSTDVVFAGRPQAYTEQDQPDATLEYGRWKAEAEALVHQAHPAALLLRTSLLYGSDLQSPIQTDVEDSIAGRSRTRFFTDEYRCPAHAADVATAIVALADRPDITGPLHITGPELMSRADIARTFAGWMGHDVAQVPTTSLAESGLTRPGMVALDCTWAAQLGLQCRPMAEALAR